MKKIILSILAIACVGIAGSVSAAASQSGTLTPAERNANLFASGAAIHVNGVYYYNGGRYYHRRFVGYRTVRVVYWVNGVRYIQYKQRPYYTYW